MAAELELDQYLVTPYRNRADEAVRTEGVTRYYGVLVPLWDDSHNMVQSIDQITWRRKYVALDVLSAKPWTDWVSMA